MIAPRHVEVPVVMRLVFHWPAAVLGKPSPWPGTAPVSRGMAGFLVLPATDLSPGLAVPPAMGLDRGVVFLVVASLYPALSAPARQVHG